MLNISDTDCSLDIATRPRNTSTLRKPPKIAGDNREKTGGIAGERRWQISRRRLTKITCQIWMNQSYFRNTLWFSLFWTFWNLHSSALQFFSYFYFIGCQKNAICFARHNINANSNVIMSGSAGSSCGACGKTSVQTFCNFSTFSLANLSNICC